MNLQGILPACITPFINGKADPDAMQANISRWLDIGVHGFVIFGSTGEFQYLEHDERRIILQAARAATPADKLFLAGCGAESTQRTLRQMEWAAEDGADAALVITPVYYTRGNTEAQRRYYLTLADSSPIPLLLYSVPAFTNYDLPVELVLELAQHPNIIGIKDSTSDLRRLTIELNAETPDFAIFSGSPNLVFPALALGAAGGIFAYGNNLPELFLTIWDAALAGDMRRAADVQAAVTQFHWEAVKFGIPGIKATLAHRGFAAGDVRSPLLPLGEEAEAQVIAAWKRAMASVGH